MILDFFIPVVAISKRFSDGKKPQQWVFAKIEAEVIPGSEVVQA
jgi:hypothetical protein